jgi:Flp pilus assembly protein TadG
MRRFRPVIQKLARDKRGTAVIETAVVATCLSILIMGTVDVARFGAQHLRDQQGVNRGLEMVMMGGPSTSTTTVQSEVSTQTGVPIANITVTQSQTCAGVAQTTYGVTCTSGQEARKFYTITVNDTFTPTFALGTVARALRGGGSTIAITKTGVIRIT